MKKPVWAALRRGKRRLCVTQFFILPFSFIVQDCGVMSSISPCEGDGPGAIPGFLTNFHAGAFDFSIEKTIFGFTRRRPV